MSEPVHLGAMLWPPALALAFFVAGFALAAEVYVPTTPPPTAVVTACGPIEWGGKP